MLVSAVPILESCDRTMIRQVATHRRNRDISRVDRFEIGAAVGSKSGAFFAYPIIQFAARIDVFADDGAGTLEALLCDMNSARNAFRDIHIE